MWIGIAQISANRYLFLTRTLTDTWLPRIFYHFDCRNNIYFQILQVKNQTKPPNQTKPSILRHLFSGEVQDSNVMQFCLKSDGIKKTPAIWREAL